MTGKSDEDTRGSSKDRGIVRFSIFLVFEALIFAFFFLFYNYSILFYLYLYSTPFLLGVIIYLFRKDMPVARNFLSKDIFVLIAVIVIWIYIYALIKQPTSYVFSITYYPAILEELNFRFVIPEVISRKTGIGRAIVIQSILYTVFYLGLPILRPGSYPGIYLYILLFDNFALSILYGAVYYLRRSIYLDVALHMSFYLVEIFLTASTAWIATVLAPV